mgnify:FL=1
MGRPVEVVTHLLIIKSYLKINVNHILLSALLLSSMVSCDGNDITPEVPDTPEQPTEGYQFTFGGSTDTDEEYIL